MIPVHISEAAAADLAAIYDYGADRFGEDVAEVYLRGFAQSFELIADHASIGAIHGTVHPPIRSLRHGSHRIYYDVFEDEVVVQRILHLAMDVGSHL
ncbi:MAG: type II toxin-antitoxin system RelE/ParE family toxin [Porphyrobacter sp.]|nr:type II toxin-antitoxin system RelE/ParE family toxin [Porphyrobacter sp.]